MTGIITWALLFHLLLNNQSPIVEPTHDVEIHTPWTLDVSPPVHDLANSGRIGLQKNLGRQLQHSKNEGLQL